MEKNFYNERLHHHRRLKSPLHNLVDSWRSGDSNLKTKFRNTYTQFALTYHGLKNILSDVQSHGDEIKKFFGESKVVQFTKQLYLKFILGVPSDNYYNYLLFKPDRWELVKDFTFRNEDVEKDFISMSVYGSIEEFRQELNPFHDKIEFYEHCKKHNIATPPISFVIDLNRETDFLVSDLNLPKKDIFVKPINGNNSIGIIKLCYQNNEYKDVKGNVFNNEDLIEYLNNTNPNPNIEKKFIIQPAIQNHKDWKPFTSGALACCRVLMARNYDEEFQPILSHIRMPTGNSISDITAQGGIGFPIDINTGKLGIGMCKKPINGSFEFEYHPDTGKKITGTLLPHWDELLEFTKRVHKTFDFIFVGWDITYTTEGFKVIEGNGIWGCETETVNKFPLSKTNYPALFNAWVQQFSENHKNESKSKTLIN